MDYGRGTLDPFGFRFIRLGQCPARSGAFLNEAICLSSRLSRKIHRRLDVIMNEDHDRNRLENSPYNHAILRHMALNVIQNDRCAARSNGRDGTMPFSANFWLLFEMRLPCFLSCKVSAASRKMGPRDWLGYAVVRAKERAARGWPLPPIVRKAIDPPVLPDRRLRK